MWTSVARLLGQRVGEPGMRVAERRDADAGQQVEVAASFRVVQVDALAADERDGLPPVGLQDVLGLEAR